MESNCIYYERNKQICGKDNLCKECKKNPNDNATLTYEEFREENYYWNCDSCKYCNPGADRDGIESLYKRLDHKRYSFAKNVFYSYNCGQDHGCICSDFEPRESRVWLFNHWDKKYINEYVSRMDDTDIIHLCIDHNWKIRYAIKKIDFVNNAFLNPDGSLKWLRKEYYKPTRKNPIGMCIAMSTLMEQLNMEQQNL